MSELILSTLPKTWIFDLDGTLLKHNGYKIDGRDTVLSGVLEYMDTIPAEDTIVIFTSRTDEYKQMTLDFLAEQRLSHSIQRQNFRFTFCNQNCVLIVG